MVATNKGHSAFLIVAYTEPVSDGTWGIGAGGMMVASKPSEREVTNLSVYVDGQAISQPSLYWVSSTAGGVLQSNGSRMTAGVGVVALPALEGGVTLGGVAQVTGGQVLGISEYSNKYSIMLPELGGAATVGKTLDGQVCMILGVRVGVSW